MQAESAGDHTEWKAACELYSHELKVAVDAIVDEGLEMIKEMEKKRSEKSVSAISAHLQVSEVTFDSKSGSYRFGTQ